MKKYRGVEI